MKPASSLLLTLTLVVAALAVYHFVFRGDETEGERELDAAAQGERERLDLQLSRVEKILSPEYDADAMRALVDTSGIPLAPEQAAQVLPLLHGHLLGLKANLKDARAAILAGKPAEARSIFHPRAAQLHSRFLGKLRNIIPPKDATALFKALPSMFPPLPAAPSGGETKPKLDPMTGMPVPGSGRDGGSK